MTMRAIETESVPQPIVRHPLWPSDTGAYIDGSYTDVCRSAFLSGIKTEAITQQKSYVLETTMIGIADVVAGALKPGGVLSSIYGREVCVLHEGVAFTTIDFDRRSATEYSEDEEAEPVRQFQVSVSGSREVAKAIFDALDRAYSQQQYAQLSWWFMGNHGVANKTVYLPPITSKLRSEFYPDVEDVSEFIRSYLASEASVLLLSGPPGTGKTTLLRHMICDYKLKAHVVYDEAIMAKDTLFQTFLFGDGDLMVIEDADTILNSRERDNNKLMARFLNVSDGLIKLPNKKLVFTTNMSDFAKIDSALVRPGRCFGLMHTRALNLEEAKVAAKVAGLPVPLNRGEYTLAELFNQNAKAPPVRTIGFASAS